MGKSLICLVVLSMVFIISAGVANATRGCPSKYESTMAGEVGVVPNSECKIDCDNDVKIEIDGVPEGEYKCCIIDFVSEMAYDAGTAVVDEEGELKCNDGDVDEVGEILAPVCTVVDAEDDCEDLPPVFISGVDAS